MREFSQRLQEGEEDVLSPQLRARILAAVPHVTPAAGGAVPRPRYMSRPLLAWGAVASALLLCVVLSPLFLKNDNSAIRAASTASSAAMPESPAASAKNSAGLAPGSANAGGSIAGSAAGNRAAQETSAAKSAAPGEDKARSFSSASASSSSQTAALPSAPSPSSADAAGMKADKPTLPAPLSADKDAPADNVAAPATPPPGLGAFSAKHAEIAQSRRESQSARIASPAVGNGTADGTVGTSPHQNKTGTPANMLSGTTTTPESGGAVPPKSVAGMTPPVPHAKLEKASVSGKMSHSLARNSHAVTQNSRYRKQADNDILLLVNNVEANRVAVNQAVTSSGGTIMSVKAIPSTDNSQAVTLTLDVPASRLPALLSRLDALGERKPLASASWRTPSHIAAGTPVNGVSPVTNGDVTDTDNSGHPSQSQNVAPSSQHSRMKSEAAPSPAAAGVTKPKPSAGFETPEARVYITIRLEKR